MKKSTLIFNICGFFDRYSSNLMLLMIILYKIMIMKMIIMNIVSLSLAVWLENRLHRFPLIFLKRWTPYSMKHRVSGLSIDRIIEATLLDTIISKEVGEELGSGLLFKQKNRGTEECPISNVQLSKTFDIGHLTFLCSSVHLFPTPA